MAVIGVSSAHGSPGATTLAVALAHRLGQQGDRAVLLLEADPDGGTIAARHQLAGAPGLTALAGAARTSIAGSDLLRYATPMHSGLAAIAGHPAAEQASAALRASAANVAEAVGSLEGVDVVIDLGRLRPGSPAQPLAQGCDALVLVCRPVADQLVAIADRLRTFERIAPLWLVLVGERPYRPSEVRRVLGVERIHVVSDAPRDVLRDPAAAGRGRRHRWAADVDRLTAALRDAQEADAPVGLDAAGGTGSDDAPAGSPAPIGMAVGR